MCTALTPRLADNPAAHNELLNALTEHVKEIDGWFVNRPPQFNMRPRFTVIRQLLEQIHDFEQLVNAAVAVVKVTSKYCVDDDWGPFLVAAFPDGDGQLKTQAQRRFLAALVENKELWDIHFGNPLIWFKRAGLPYDRKACVKLLIQAGGRISYWSMWL
jgi:hypothetical protein